MIDGFKSRMVVEGDIIRALKKSGVPREMVADSGISFIRRANTTGHDYFFTNLTAKKFEGWITPGVAAHAAILRDPLNGRTGMAAIRTLNHQIQVYCQLAPGESLLLETIAAGNKIDNPENWQYLHPAGTPVPVDGRWKINFIKGGPVIPGPVHTDTLQCWTRLGNDETKRFGGTARYQIEFDAPAVEADEWMLQLGDVRESARVRINGRFVATLWSIPFQVPVGKYLKKGRNVLEVEVTNLAANRIRDMDQRKVNWKIMREINFVNIDYKPFDASGWELTPSGLIGPVKLLPMKQWTP
jgi:hypothetical protein